MTVWPVVLVGFLIASFPPSAFAQVDAQEYFLRAQQYEHGDGVPRDLAAAVEWYSKAAELGHGEAQLALGAMYHGGYGVPGDPVKDRKSVV